MAVGPVVAFLSAEPLTPSILGGCFFEEGRGSTEVPRLFAPVLALLVTATVAELVARALINRAVAR
jgi:hypothetical protein